LIEGVERNDLNDERVENMATFLQSLDSDDNSSNIVITDEVREALEGVELNLEDSSVTESDIKSVIDEVSKKVQEIEYVDEETAMEHVKEQLETYADIDEFEEHVDDSLISATLVTSGLDGIIYETTSGHSGTTEADGVFLYETGDEITFKYSDGNIIAIVTAEDIGTDNIITNGELQEIALSQATDIQITQEIEEVQVEETQTEETEEMEETQETSEDIIIDNDEIYDFNGLKEDIETENQTESNTENSNDDIDLDLGEVLDDFDDSNINLDNIESSNEQDVNNEDTPATVDSSESSDGEISNNPTDGCDVYVDIGGHDSTLDQNFGSNDYDM